jgi:hypothetical protein
MRQVLGAVFGLAVLAGGLGVAGPAMAAADEHAAYYNACIRVSPALKAACACRADAAMKVGAELRADIILSMSNPGAYAAKARSGKVSANIIHQWEQFSADSARQCHVDN